MIDVTEKAEAGGLDPVIGGMMKYDDAYKFYRGGLKIIRCS